MDWLIVLLFFVLWGIVMKALITPLNKSEGYVAVLFYIGLFLVIPYIIFILLGGDRNEREIK